tara:strand:- start:81 stop:359 length:279 start_codon:yes stop_codon:yes gene_type:complete
MENPYDYARELNPLFEELGFWWIDSGESNWELFQYQESDESCWYEVRIWLDRIEFIRCNHNEINWKATDDQVLFESDSIDEVLSIIKSNERE